MGSDTPIHIVLNYIKAKQANKNILCSLLPLLQLTMLAFRFIIKFLTSFRFIFILCV